MSLYIFSIFFSFLSILNGINSQLVTLYDSPITPLELNYYNSIYNHDKQNQTQDKIFQGSSAKALPFFAAIVQYQDDGSVNIVCGASILDQTHLVTAAHCVDPIIQLANSGVRLEAWAGGNNLDNYNGQKVGLYQIAKHPNYEGQPNFWNDIGVVVLASEFKLTKSVQPICIGTDNYDGQQVALIGFGVYDCYNPSRQLLFGYGNALDASNCVKQGHKNNLMSGQVCSKLVNGDNQGADQAPGDSGGPLFAMNIKNRPFVQVGLVSYNNIRDGRKDSNGKPRDPCPNLNVPGTYTRVGYYLDWIRQFAPQAQQC